jgi:serine/threonine protein phosphatase PrpC
MIELDIAMAEIIGTRAEQQDASAIMPLGEGGDAALLVLADGLGGHADGATAARIVVETFRERAVNGAFARAETNRRALDDAILETNARIRTARDPSDGERGMASTAVAAVLAEGCLNWVSVGDSHLYVWRQGRLAKLNADHSQAGMMIRDGRAPDDPAVLAASSLLASALSGYTIEEIDRPIASVPLAPDDVVLLASDGLDVLSDADIAQIIDENAETDAATLARTLVTTVEGLRMPRQDNATVVVARVLGAGHPATPEDMLPRSVVRPGSGPHNAGSGGRWSLTVGLVLLAAILASVIVTQMP